MNVLRNLAAVALAGIGLVGVGAANVSTADTSGAAGQQPVYAIAHRVDTLDGVNAAIKHGANGIEVDVCGWSKPDEWRAHHDCAGTNREGPTLSSWIDRAISQSGPEHKLSLVWLDIKDPDYCAEQQNRACGVAGLHDQAQRLTKAGIQVMYGFFGYKPGEIGGRGWQSLQGKLGPMEGMTVTGSLKTVEDAYAKYGKGFPERQRAMDYGDSNIGKGFGNCTEAGYNTCAELKLGAKDRAAGKLRATFSWTSTLNDKSYVDQLLDAGQLDGIIAGYGESTGLKDYADTPECAKAIGLVRDWVSRHGSTHRLATGKDRLFA
jgi:hypothetical protein